MTKEEKDLIQRAQDIQRYTENRCNTLEERIAEQEETIDAQDEKINFYVSKMNENILKRQALEKENAELKAKLKGFENGDVAWQGDMDKTIKQNLELKEQIERISVTNFDVIKKLKEQIEKMKCCGNCINHNDLCYCELDRKEVNASNVCNKWEWEKEE